MTLVLRLHSLSSSAVTLALMCLAIGSPAAAQNVSVQARSLAPLSGQQAQDESVVDQVLAAIGNGGPTAAEPFVPALKAVLSHAPTSFPVVERSGDTIIIRADSDNEYLMLSLVAGTESSKSQPNPRSVSVVRERNTYPMAALELGSYFDDIQKYDEAMPFLDQGLTIQPNSPFLIVEKGASLFAQRRFAEAVALYDAALASKDLALIDSRSRLLRNRGVALIDLGRLDEAEKALKDSIEANKSDALGVERANRELVYISHLRAGAAPARGVIQTRGEFNKEKDAAANPPH